VGNPDSNPLSNLLTDVTAAKCLAAFDPGGPSMNMPVSPPPQPYTADCRWHTQNVSVHDNVFTFTASNIPGCTVQNTCGMNGIFSNWGSEWPWEPYLGPGTSDAITSQQNNVFSKNTYTGPWMFMVHDQATVVSFTDWQAAPYSQDMGSTIQ
jgi:hypothetical protein